MILGILLHALNAVYFGDLLTLVFEFVPQIIFMTGLFGYMNLLIYLKWIQDWTQMKLNPPSIIATMINLALQVGKLGTEENIYPLKGEPWDNFVNTGPASLADDRKKF